MNEFKSSMEEYNFYNDIPTSKSKLRMIKNNKAIIIFFIGLIVVIVIIASVFLYNEGPRLFGNYSLSVEANKTLYLGESLDVGTVAKGGSKKQMITYFDLSDDYTTYMLYDEISGTHETSNVIVPIQEGETTLNVYLGLERYRGEDDDYLVEKNVDFSVCPKFDTDLLTVSQLSVAKNSTYKLNIDFGSEECSSNIVYVSGNTSILKVNDQGIVRGIKVGATKLTISKGNKSFSIPVVVTNNVVKVSDLKVDYNKLQLMPGDNFRLSVKQLPINSTVSNLRYTSTNPSVASITSTGLIKAYKPGSTIINISNGNIRKNIIVVVDDIDIVQAEATNISLSKAQLVLKKGQSERIISVVTPDAALNSLNRWTSSDENVAVVNRNGVVYANGVGATTITVKNGNISKSVSVMVTK